MATITIFNQFRYNLGKAIVDLSLHTFKIYLSNEAPLEDTDSIKADIADITNEHGYAPLALTCTWTETAVNSGIWRFAASADPSWTATGGNFGPFQYAILYDDTPTSPADPLLGYFDFAAPQTATTGITFTIDLDSNFTLFQLT